MPSRRTLLMHGMRMHHKGVVRLKLDTHLRVPCMPPSQLLHVMPSKRHAGHALPCKRLFSLAAGALHVAGMRPHARFTCCS